MNIEDIMDIKSIKSVLKNQEIYKFATVGIIGTPIVLLITAILTSMLGIFYAISAIIALEIWTIIGFFIHERWTFSSAPKNTNVINRMLKNNFFAFMGFGINEVILIFLTSTLGINYLLSESIAIIMTFIFNFTVSKKITWKN